MPRKGSVPRRKIQLDPIYKSEMVARLTNKLMMDGEKARAQRIVYSALTVIEEKSGQKALEILEAALKNIMPLVEVKPRRVGGSTYQVPVEVRPERRTSLGLRWLVLYARQRGERNMIDRLAGELLDAANGTGAAVKKREDVHRMADANRPFAHYRW